ncbi:MAG TPA: hypothetical protein VGV13_11605 [Methylomirabilota bacterium]|jgi:DNA-binding transcriptional ArsR family regulator|nr:hypothetical protein [Methylomirabilota bacterium]
MPTAEDVAARIARLLAEKPRTFYEVLRQLGDVEYRVVLQAWGALREGQRLARDPEGHYLLKG